MKNYYDILGVSPGATKDEIKSAYRKLSVKFHPDKNSGEDFFEAMFKKINEAHEVLTNDTKRARYDFELKSFSERNYDYSKEEELKKKENELRRRQDELLKKERDLSNQRYTEQSEPAYSQQSSGINWGQIVNYLLILNVILLGIIYLTPAKGGKSNTESSPAADTESKIRKKSISPTPIKPKTFELTKQAVTSLPDTTTDLTANDKVQEPAISQPESPSNTEKPIVSTNTSEPDSVAEKPKWIQFKKRRNWNKKKKEVNKE